MAEKPQNKLNIDEMATFCKKKGFVYSSSEIYGSLAGFFDFGPYGVELFNNIKQNWWKHFVHDKELMTGIDASIISHPRVWRASGHLDSFGDLVLACSKCNFKSRADHFIEENLKKNVEGAPIDEIKKIIQDNSLTCPKCKGKFKELKNFNLLFSTSVGAEEGKESTVYLRGETAQGMFTNFRLITDTARKTLPFGIAQIGKCFRNEISPRNFLFRSREFTIAEFEFFLSPEEKTCEFLEDSQKDLKLMLLDAKTQEKGKLDHKETTIKEMLKENLLDEWHAYWLAEQLMWFYSLGLKKEHLKVREHTGKELSHYSSGTFDIDYDFPFGTKELAGNADRGQYDMTQHIKESKEKLEYFDQVTNKRIIPRVIEPTFGMERAFLALLVDSYEDDKERGNIVLKIKPTLAPIKLGIFPLLSNKPELMKKAKEVFNDLKGCYTSQFDKSGAIGRRYARADELGIPYCITIDFDTLEDDTVTVRHRDTTEQIRVKIPELRDKIFSYLYGEKFE